MNGSIESLNAMIRLAGMDPDTAGRIQGFRPVEETQAYREAKARLIQRALSVAQVQRCACQDPDCAACLEGCSEEAARDVSMRRDLFPCRRNAVTNVTFSRTVRMPVPSGHAVDVDVEEDVPMCAPCAAHQRSQS